MSIRIETLGDLRDNGYTLTLHCTAIRCLRPLDVDLARMIELFGADTVYVAKRWPVKCAKCGCRQISMTLGQNAPKIRIMPSVGG